MESDPGADTANGSDAAVRAFLQALGAHPYRFGFFPALRRLECLHPHQPGLGRSSRAEQDPIRLGVDPSMAFPAATLAGLDHQSPGRPPRLAVNFLGLLGPRGPLPLHLTEYIHDRLHNAHDPTFARFLDVFHHRMLSLFYRAWANAQPAVNLDRPDQDRFALYIGALFGLGMPALRRRDALPDLAKLYYAGRFVPHTRNAEGLCAMVEDWLGVKVGIDEFVGAWMDLPEDSRWRLGQDTGGRQGGVGQLGTDTILGARVWGYQHKFRLILGPMDLDDYVRLLPGGDGLVRLEAMVRNYVGDELQWDLRLVLRREQAPPLRLGGAGRLGWTTWCRNRPLGADAGDLVLAV